jgi:Predicted transcriptional regulator
MSKNLLFSKRLRELRESEGLSQGQLADEVGISRGSVSFYENGDRLPDIEVLQKLSKHFNTSADYLIGNSEIRRHEFEVKLEDLGLSDEAIKSLLYLPNSFDEELPKIRDLLNWIISHEDFPGLLHLILNSIDAEELSKCWGTAEDMSIEKGFQGLTKEYINDYALKRKFETILRNIKRQAD